MEWTQFIIFFAGIAGLWFWQRSETRADLRHMDAKLDSNKELIHAIHKETATMMKDFHIRLERQDAEFKGRMEKIELDYRNGLLRIEEQVRLKSAK